MGASPLRLPDCGQGDPNIMNDPIAIVEAWNGKDKNIRRIIRQVYTYMALTGEKANTII